MKDPYPARTGCKFEGCLLSVEEHHRLNAGKVAEVAQLKAQLEAARRAGPEFELSSISSAQLVKELERRLGL